MVGDVDIKAKIVGVGQATEAVNIYCTRKGGSHQHWDTETELQAREVIAAIKQHLGSEHYKTIPISTHNSAGIKVSDIRHGQQHHHDSALPSAMTLDLFHTICQFVEYDASQRVFVARREGSIVSSGSLTEHALRREIARIIQSGQHLETKVSDIVRLIGPRQEA